MMFNRVLSHFPGVLFCFLKSQWFRGKMTETASFNKEKSVNRITFGSLIFGAITSAVALNVAVPAAADSKTSHSQADCKSDDECVAITELQQACRHEDPKSREICPAVNRKYAAEIERIECFQNAGCRPIAKITCRDGECRGEESRK